MSERGETYRGYEVILYDNEYGYPSEPEVFFLTLKNALAYGRLMYPVTRLVCIDWVSGGPDGQGYASVTTARWLNKNIEPKERFPDETPTLQDL